MHKVRLFFQKNFTPVTIMLVPHSRFRSFSIKLPVFGLYLILLLSIVGSICLVGMSLQAAKYYQAKARLAYVNTQFAEISNTVKSLKEAESKFRKLFSLQSKRDVMDAVLVEDTGSVNMEALKQQIDASIKSVREIRVYLDEQKDVYLSTPIGWPAKGRISSDYGIRMHPLLGRRMLHAGVDISMPSGTPLRATAEGVVSFVGWEGRGGNTVVVEDGNGFRTAFAHNRKNIVKVGQRVHRGDVIAFSGATGAVSGPHVHYEVWKNGKSVDPSDYLNHWVD